MCVKESPVAFSHVLLQYCWFPVIQASQEPHGEIGNAVTLSPICKMAIRSDMVIKIPDTNPFISPILSIVPLQLFAY